MSSDIRRNDTGLFTAEGMVAGPRAARMAKYREEQKAAYEKVCVVHQRPPFSTHLCDQAPSSYVCLCSPLTHTHHDRAKKL